MKRDLEESLKRWREKPERKPLLLMGARQVGKTYLLKWFGSQYFRKTHLINFERDPGLRRLFDVDLKPQRIVDELSLALGQRLSVEEDLLIFDEVQACPPALTSLKYFAEELPQLALCAAGSLLGVTLNEQSFPVGKVDQLTLFPMNFMEFLCGIEASDLVDVLSNFEGRDHLPSAAHDRLWQLWKVYLIVGGLPEVVRGYQQNLGDSVLAQFKAVDSIQQNLIAGYLADVAKHSGKVNALHIERVWNSVPAQMARSIDSRVQRFKFKGVVKGVDKYSRLAGAIDWLVAAGLVVKANITKQGLQPFSAFTHESHFKLYMFDVGILRALSGLSPQAILNYDYGTYKGFFAENFVAQELGALGHKQLYAWSEAKAEIEFLMEVKGSVIPIEVKAGQVTKSKSLSVFRQKYQPPISVIFSGKAFERKKGGLLRMPIYAVNRLPALLAARGRLG